MAKGIVQDGASSANEVVRANHNRLVADVQGLLNGDLLISAPTIGIGSTPTNVATGAFVFQIDGVRERKAAVAAGTAFTATTHDIADPTALPREAIYVLSVAVGGTITITKGADAAAGAAVAPATPANEVKLGEVLIQHDGTAIFDATTDQLDAAHLTVTYTPAAAAVLTGQTVLRR